MQHLSRVQAHVTTLSLIIRMFLVLPNFDFALLAPPLHRSRQSFALGHVSEFACIARAFSFFALTLAFLKTINALLGLHPLDIISPYSNSLLNFQLDSNLKFSMDSFKSAFMCMSHLLTNDLSSVVFEHL